MTAPINIIDAVQDRHIFADSFRDQSTWAAWFSFLACLFGLPLDQAQLDILRQCTGRNEPNPNGYREAWLICGRRSGKSFILALNAVFLACFREWRQHLAPGELGTVMIIAADRKQARTILRYCKGLLQSSPMLRTLIQSETQESITLNNSITIEVHSCSFRSVRGYTIVAALLDEMAFWPTDDFAAEPDVEVLHAVRPGMATVPGAMLLCASSPYGRRGEMWNAYHQHNGHDSDVLVWQAPTRVMNPTVPQSEVDAALARDPEANRAEFLAKFRSDIEQFIRREAVESCIDLGVIERPPKLGQRYVGFVDPSGGSVDSATLCIGHQDGEAIVVDLLREVPAPHIPENVVAEFSDLLAKYRVNQVHGDRYSGQWCAQAFQRWNINYQPSDLPKSALYLETLPKLNSKSIRLLDHPKCINQLCSLERRTARGGRDSIDHPRGGHDDLANAVAGVVAMIATNSSLLDDGSWMHDPSVPLRETDLHLQARRMYWSRYLW
jgi:hypothetical protein